MFVIFRIDTKFKKTIKKRNHRVYALFRSSEVWFTTTILNTESYETSQEKAGYPYYHEKVTQ